MMQSTTCLPRFSNSLPLKCNVHKIIKRPFYGLWLKGRGGKRWTNVLAMWS